MLDPEVIPIPPRLQPVGLGLQYLIDFVHGLMPSATAEALAFLQQIQHAIYAVFCDFYENLPQILSSCGATELTGPTVYGEITFTDVDAERVTATLPLLWREQFYNGGSDLLAYATNMWCPSYQKPIDSAPPAEAGTLLRRYSPLSAPAIRTLMSMLCGQWLPGSRAAAYADVTSVINLTHNWAQLYLPKIVPLVIAYGGLNVFVSGRRCQYELDGGGSSDNLYRGCDLPVPIERDASSYKCQTPARLLVTACTGFYPTRLLPILLGDKPYTPAQSPMPA
jgi:hypothetical protein